MSSITINTGSEVECACLDPAIVAALRQASAFRERERTISSAEDLEKLEKEAGQIADALFQALLAPSLQQAVDSPQVLEAAQQLVRGLPRRMRSDGPTTVNVRTSRGAVIPIKTRYYRERSRKGSQRRPGLYPALAVLGIWDRCTPTLGSNVSRAVVMLGSLKEAQAHLSEQGIDLDPKTIRSIAYRYAARARAVQRAGGFRPGEGAAGRRVVISLDGGRARIRKNKRGRKTPKGRSRYRTDWHEPKLIILYVLDEDGRPSQTWAPIIDGTLRGPDAAFALIQTYAERVNLAEADKVLFVADGARWIWTRVETLVAALGLRCDQVFALIDYYHATEHLADAVNLRRWPAKKRKRWLNHNRRLLRRGQVDRVIAEFKQICRGRNAGKIRTHMGYFIRNRDRFGYTRVARLKLPKGSGAMESAIRRVINLRIKGASIYWLEENIDAILMLRSYYKSNRWSCLHRMATCPQGVLQ